MLLTPGVRHFHSCGSHYQLIFGVCKDLTKVRSLPQEFRVRDAVLIRAQLEQIETAFNPLVNTCVITNTHKGLVNALAVLVADMVLLLALLIGLLRHTSKGSSCLWKLLYRQVSSSRSSSDSNAELLLEYNLDSLGGVCRDSTRGQSVSAIQVLVTSSTFRKVFLILNLNGAYFSARACEGGS